MFNVQKVNADIRILTLAQFITDVQSQGKIIALYASGEDILQITFHTPAPSNVTVQTPQFAPQPFLNGQSLPAYIGPKSIIYKLTDAYIEKALGALVEAIPELVITPEQYIEAQYHSANITNASNHRPAIPYISNPLLQTFGLNIPKDQGVQYIPVSINIMERDENTGFITGANSLRLMRVDNYDEANKLFTKCQETYEEGRHNHSVIDLFRVLGKGEFEFSTHTYFYKLKVNDRTIYIRNLSAWPTPVQFKAEPELENFDHALWSFNLYAEYVEGKGAKYYNILYDLLDALNKDLHGEDSTVGASILPAEIVSRQHDEDDE